MDFHSESRKEVAPKQEVSNQNPSQIIQNLTSEYSISLPEKMLSKSMSCLNDDSEDDLFPNSPESAEESFTSLPHSEPHDAVLNDLMPPRPSSDGDQPTSTSNKTFKCTRCKYETDRKNNLKRHITTMHDPAPSTLDCCGTRFATKGDLREHTKAAHGSGYTCWQCGHNFCRRALLQRHQSVHSGLKAFSCSKCGYQSSHKSNMQRHMQVHFQTRTSGSSGLKDRLKSNLKSNVRTSPWKNIDGPLRHGQSSTSRGFPAAIHRRFTDEANRRSTAINSEAEFPPVKHIPFEQYRHASDHGPFSRVLSNIAAAHWLKAPNSLHDANKNNFVQNQSSLGWRNKMNPNAPEIWRLAFGQQGVGNDDKPQFDSNNFQFPQQLPDVSGRISENNYHLPLLVVSNTTPTARLLDLSTKSKHHHLQHAPRIEVEDSVANKLPPPETSSHGLPGDETCLQNRHPQQQSAFVRVCPLGGKLHRPIPRYGVVRPLDFSISSFMNTLNSPRGNRDRMLDTAVHGKSSTDPAEAQRCTASVASPCQPANLIVSLPVAQPVINQCPASLHPFMSLHENSSEFQSRIPFINCFFEPCSASVSSFVGNNTSSSKLNTTFDIDINATCKEPIDYSVKKSKLACAEHNGTNLTSSIDDNSSYVGRREPCLGCSSKSPEASAISFRLSNSRPWTGDSCSQSGNSTNEIDNCATPKYCQDRESDVRTSTLNVNEVVPEPYDLSQVYIPKKLRALKRAE